MEAAEAANAKNAPAAAPVTEDNTSPPAAAAATADNAPVPQLKDPPASSLPTYDGSEASQYYVVAKTLLNEGDFEGALATIEEGIAATQAQLPEGSTTLHESMGPFHYLYGTTLLYSVEESVDPQQQMTNAIGGGGDKNEEAEQGAAAAASGTAGREGEPEEGVCEQNVEDLQIAWEDLETARTIIDRLVKENNEPSKDDKLKADLAQVHLRCGDLQRINSAYENAIADYTACLQYRQSASTIPKFSRKIADVHYNLGLVFFSKVAETKIPEDNPEESALVKKSLDAARSQAYYHFFECGKVFGGILAELCGADPEELLKEAEQIPNFKTTGEEEQDGSFGHEHPKVLGLKLNNLRQAVSELKVPEAAQLDYSDCVTVLEEIQETIDEAENSEKGVHEAKDMKEEISAAIAAQAGESTTTTTGDVGEDNNGATTTIGFGTAAAAASTAAAQPIMMVKKKKRNADEHGEDVKLPAKEPAKRQKSSE